MKTIAIIQARMGSTRLPGKVMKRLCDQTVLSHVIHRVQACPLIDEIVIATTLASQDDVVVQEAEACGVLLFRGSEADVLERYYLAAKKHQADTVIRITSDCPLLDPTVLSEMLAYFQSESTEGLALDYLSNTLQRSYPRGLDAEVFTFSALDKAHREAKDPYEREHVTPFIYQHPELFSIHQHVQDVDLSSHRWTLDTEEDFHFIKLVYDALGERNSVFETDNVLAFLDQNPEIIKINAHVQQKP